MRFFFRVAHTCRPQLPLTGFNKSNATSAAADGCVYIAAGRGGGEVRQMEEDSSSPELDLFQKELVLRRICRVLPRHHPLCTLPNLLAAAARDQYGRRRSTNCVGAGSARGLAR